LTILSVAQVLW